jgi:hypothetical protein
MSVVNTCELSVGEPTIFTYRKPSSQVRHAYSFLDEFWQLRHSPMHCLKVAIDQSRYAGQRKAQARKFLDQSCVEETFLWIRAVLRLFCRVGVRTRELGIYR